MTLIQLSQVSKYFGAAPLIEGVDFKINKGEKIGIIGLNGIGKTTLLKLISGDTEPDRGTISRTRGVRVAYVPQVLTGDSQRTVLDLSYEMHPELAATKKSLAECEFKMGLPDFSGSPDEQKVLHKYSEALENFGLNEGYSLESTLSSHLERIGLRRLSPDRKLSELSAGEIKVAQIAAALSAKPDIILIDEPTNHADIMTSEAIDDLIMNSRQNVVFVTHDRYLLNKVNQRIVEVRDGNLVEFKGTYDEYIDFRDRFFEAQTHKYDVQERQRARMNETVQRLKSKSSGGDDKAGRKAKNMERQMGKMVMGRPREVRDDLKFHIPRGERGGDIVVKGEGVHKSFGDREVLRDVNLLVTSGERIGLVGNSGSGKTTLLNCLLGFEPVDKGVVRVGPSIRVGYLSQGDITLNSNLSIYDELSSAGCSNTNTAYGLLNSWLFRNNNLDQQVGTLSGGEKKKLQLMKIMLSRPNLLVLDEPTDHLDMASREGLEIAVNNFDGSLIVATRDRYLLDKLTKKTLVLADHKLLSFDGNYSVNAGEVRRHLNL